MNGQKPTISVITPFYRGNAYLEALLQNLDEAADLFLQAYPGGSAEFILVNDSPDEEVILPEGDHPYAVTVLTMPVNSGIHSARAEGVRKAAGEWILFLDQDDKIAPEFFVSQLQCAGDRDAVVSNYWMENAEGKAELGYRKDSEMTRLNDKAAYLYSHNVIKSPGQCLIKKSAVPAEWMAFKLEENGADDLFLWLLFLESGKQFALNEKPLYIHRFTGQNLSESVLRMGASTLKAADLLKEIPWFPKKDVRILEDARDFDKSWQQGSVGKKTAAVFMHPGIFLRRAVLKTRVKFGRDYTA